MGNDPSAFFESLLAKPEQAQTIADSLLKTLAGFTDLPFKSTAPTLEKTANAPQAEAAAVIRLDGPKLSLELLLCFRGEFLLQLYENATQQQGTLAEAGDVAGEILNVAFGFMDGVFAAQGFKMRSSFPLNFTGAKLASLLATLPAPNLQILFKAADQEIVLKILSPGSLNCKWNYTPVKSA